MMIQQLIIFLIFIGAAFYVGRLFYFSFKGKAGGCAKGCGGACSTIDFDQIKRKAADTARF